MKTLCDTFAESGFPWDSRVRLDFGLTQEPRRTKQDGDGCMVVVDDFLSWEELNQREGQFQRHRRSDWIKVAKFQETLNRDRAQISAQSGAEARRRANSYLRAKNAKIAL